jgi:uncharacterized RDD family membrane protein YckC
VSQRTSTAMMDMTRQGQYAGGVSRIVALLADIGISWGLYVAGVAAYGLFYELLSGKNFNANKNQLAWSIVLAVWEFLYFSLQWSLSGRTLGMAIFGLRVVSKEGAPIGLGTAMLRTIVLAVSLIFIILVCLAALVQRQRRALHDLVAGTAVVYNWDARGARLRWLASQTPTKQQAPAPG